MSLVMHPDLSFLRQLEATGGGLRALNRLSAGRPAPSWFACEINHSHPRLPYRHGQRNVYTRGNVRFDVVKLTF